MNYPRINSEFINFFCSTDYLDRENMYNNILKYNNIEISALTIFLNIDDSFAKYVVNFAKFNKENYWIKSSTGVIHKNSITKKNIAVDLELILKRINLPQLIK